MNTAACRRWLADHLTGLDTLLLATRNVQAAALARRARDELAALGLVARSMTDHARADEGAPPAGNAIVRLLRHVRAVRERHAGQRAARSPGAASRSARAWSWALGETATAPVTDRVTPLPPSRADIEAEIAEADERRLNGDRENRVGGFGGVVRSRDQVAEMIALLGNCVRGSDEAGAGDLVRDGDCRDGVIATLNWVLSRTTEAPIRQAPVPRPTTGDLKAERLHAQDVIGRTDTSARHISAGYGLGVERAVDWLLGEAGRFWMSALGG